MNIETCHKYVKATECHTFFTKVNEDVFYVRIEDEVELYMDKDWNPILSAMKMAELAANINWKPLK